MKPNSSNSGEEVPTKSVQNKTKKTSTKSRSKSSKTNEVGNSNAAKSTTISIGANNTALSNSSMLVTTPTTPTTLNTGSVFEASLPGGTNATSGSGGAGGSGGNGSTDVNSANTRNQHKSYVGLEPRSIKIIWEQHDQSDIELSTEVCARMAEDASYKLWELVNNVKIYARHSGGVVTYDLVNEVLRDSDVPPALGAMDSDWERIDYDGSYYFYADKIIELREEYQKEVVINAPYDAELSFAWPVEDKAAEILKKYIPSLIYVVLHGDAAALDTGLAEAAFTPVLGSCYRVILAKLIQVLAFKQNDSISARCWRLLRACAMNPCARDVSCREEYYHLTEILICQLLAPFESIKVHGELVKQEEQRDPTIKMEIDDIKLEQEMDMKMEYSEHTATTPATGAQSQEQTAEQLHLPEEKIYKLQPDDDDNDDAIMADGESAQQSGNTSAYFASPVDWKYVDELCETIGYLAGISGYFGSECIFHIRRRLERFFKGRELNSEREFNFLSRAVRGLIALGGHAFREFIPFAYKLKVDDLPEMLWKDFAMAGYFLTGPDDIFLYEWLECLCGADKLQPFLVHYAQYYEKFLSLRFLRRKVATFKIVPKVAVRRLEWNTLAAAMCLGDDPNKALKPKPTLKEVFPDLTIPNLRRNRPGNIRFKFAGCRPVIIKSKTTNSRDGNATTTTSGVGAMSTAQSDILIARRKLFKPLTNERRVVPLSSYYFVRI